MYLFYVVKTNHRMSLGLGASKRILHAFVPDLEHTSQQGQLLKLQLYFMKVLFESRAI